ncbi:MAG TPA: type II toxin-antitoxin system HicA family toxin [Urbifossiella sp.]
MKRCEIKACETVSGKRLCKRLEDRDWYLDRISGSHRIYIHPGRGRPTVPVHGNKDLKPGTQKSIMRDAGLTEDDLERFIGHFISIACCK